MKRNIVESYSIEEAFRALNKKPTKNTEKIVEAIEAALKIPSPYNKYFEIIDSNEIEFEDGMFQIGEKVDGATILAYLAAKDEYLDRFDSDAFLIDDPACPVVEIIHDRCYPIEVESMEEAFRALNRKANFKQRINLGESADSTYTAIMLKETVLAIGDVDSDENHYDTVKDEFIPITIKANSDREAIEKIAKYVPIVLDDYDYSEDELIDEINNTAVFPIAFEDWNAYYYKVGDSNTALISFKRPDGTELATESEIQAIDADDAVKKYTEFHMPETSIENWGLKFDSITVGKQLSL